MPGELNFAQLIRILCQQEDLKFLIIGGHAVNLYGYSRDTHDLDLLVRRADASRWKELLASLGYSIFRDETAFVQFTPTHAPAIWPLDLMLVNDTTFEKLLGGSQRFAYRGVEAPVPAVEHLIALKLHVLKQQISHRTIKDFMDVQGLVEHNKVDVRSAEMREIFEKHGTESFTAASKKPMIKTIQKTKSFDFELPGTPHFVSKPPRLAFEHSVALCEEGLEWDKSRPGFEEKRLRSKCYEEFRM